MLSAIATDQERLLQAGKFYFCGSSIGIRSPDDTLPLTAFRHGWHPRENWGCWAARRDAQLSLRTPYKNGTAVTIAVSLHAPPGSKKANCTLRIGDVDAPRRKITRYAAWFLAEGVAGYDGWVRVTLLADGEFGRPDPRELYVGVHSITFCSSDDKQTREELIRKTTISPLTAARNAALSVIALLDGLRNLGDKSSSRNGRGESPQNRTFAGPFPLDVGKRISDLELASSINEIAPELAPRPIQDLLHHHSETIEVRQLGRTERTHWGMLRSLRGVEAIRGFYISFIPIIELQILINGYAIHKGPLRGGYPLKYELNKDAARKYVFNVWYDFSATPIGRYEIELRFIDANQRIRSQREQVVIAAPLSATEYPAFDSVVSVPKVDPESLERAINELPNMVRPAKRALFETPPRNVLVMRVDQLGDMVLSVPAVRRLREILPDARLVALVTVANEDLARSLGLFDEIIVAEFPDDAFERRRLMTIDKQLELKSKLAEYKFDLAIDLQVSDNSRPLMLLSGAKFLYGFSFYDFPWLSGGGEGKTRDFRNGMELLSHSTKVTGFVEWLGAAMNNRFQVTRRSDLRRETLTPFGIDVTDRFAVLHDGARIKYSRWPYYQDLAKLIVDNTSLKVIMISDDPDQRSRLGVELLNSSRFQLIDNRLPFDELDALLSFCTLFVGNDSGPKHLASLRGANVVSIHMARNNWNEWGQDEMGLIISRKVPCAGCAIFHDPEECGKDFACITHISANEVFSASMQLINPTRPSGDTDASDGSHKSP